MEPLVVGIDPGTTLGYAVLDTYGNLIAIRSGRTYSLPILLKELTSLGDVAMVATDKANPPTLCRKVSAKLGAALSWPRKDLAVAEKKSLTKRYSYANSHEMDSLAAALYALKGVRPKMRRIESYVRRSKDPALEAPLKKLMIRQGSLSLADAVDILTTPSAPPTVSRERKKEGRDRKLDRLRELLTQKDREIAILRRKGKGRVIRVEELRDPRTSSDELVHLKERRIRSLDQQARLLREVIRAKDGEIRLLNRMLSLAGSNLLVRRVRSLGKAELGDVKQQEIIMIEDPSSFSASAVQLLADKHAMLISPKRFPAQVSRQVSTIRMKPVLASQHYAVVDSKEFDSARSGLDISEVVESYRSDR